MSSTDSNQSTPDNPVAVAQFRVLKIGEGQALANKLNQHIRRSERGEIGLKEAVELAASCDQLLSDIFETRSLTFEKQTDDKGKTTAPEFGRVKATVNTLRLRLSQAYPTQIPARSTKAAEVGAQFGF